MKLFSSPTSYIGIDIGTSSIKMVELENYKDQARLKTYGYADVPVNVLHSAIEKNNQVIADHINQIANKARIQTRQVVAALPTFSVFNFIITLPPMPRKDLASAIKWEAKKFIPVPIEEMILDWKILNKRKVKEGKKDKQDFTDSDKGKQEKIEAKMPDDIDKAVDEVSGMMDKKSDPNSIDIKKGRSDTEENYRILLTAAPKNLVARYIDIFKRAKMNLLSLETEAFALARSLIGNDMSTIMIVDIGATTADITVIEQGVPILNRGIDTGGDFITKTIMNSLNVNEQRAEQFKRDFGLSSEGSQNVPEVIKQSLNSIINEIKYVFDLYSRQGNTHVEKIIITGGSAFLPKLPEFLSELLNLPVIIGDPWDRVIYPMDLKPVLTEIGPRMAAAIGLAMRDI